MERQNFVQSQIQVIQLLSWMHFLRQHMAIRLILGIAPLTSTIWVLTPALQTCDLYLVFKMLFIYVCVHIVYI